MRRRKLSLQSKFLLSITLIIFPTLSIIFTWEGVQRERHAMDQLMNQARVLARQVILTRRWISDCGGVYVLKNSKGASGTTYFFDDRLETPRGCYQKFTPSMVTKKLSQYSLRQDIYRFRLASLNPLNPENSPDEFERVALKGFEEGTCKEAYKIEASDRGEFLRYMVPLTMDKTCLKCHHVQGLAEGSIGGGLSIFIPMRNMKASLMKNYLQLAAAGAGLIVLTISTLFVMLRRMVIRPMRELELMTAEISRGNLDARVNIRTGDEVEKLGKAFNEMAEKLSEGRNLLEKKIEQATRELSEANRELQTLDQLKSDFLANMSHELRSPLTVIRGGIDYLNRTIKGTENRRYLAIIDKNLSRLIHLVTDLFDFTRIEANKAEWNFVRENLSWLIKEVADIVSPLATDKNMSICYEYDRDIFVVMDLERIEQVLVNLIENAIKFSDPGSRIDLNIKEKENEVLVSVRDYGVGIPKENLEVIFEKFRTLPSSGGKNKREGTGLGLAICKGIIEAHGGRIWAESIEGKGSIFYFTLPRNHNPDE